LGALTSARIPSLDLELLYPASPEEMPSTDLVEDWAEGELGEGLRLTPAALRRALWECLEYGTSIGRQPITSLGAAFIRVISSLLAPGGRSWLRCAVGWQMGGESPTPFKGTGAAARGRTLSSFQPTDSSPDQCALAAGLAIILDLGLAALL